MVSGKIFSFLFEYWWLVILIIYVVTNTIFVDCYYKKIKDGFKCVDGVVVKGFWVNTKLNYFRYIVEYEVDNYKYYAYFDVYTKVLNLNKKVYQEGSLVKVLYHKDDPNYWKVDFYKE